MSTLSLLHNYKTAGQFAPDAPEGMFWFPDKMTQLVPSFSRPKRITISRNQFISGCMMVPVCVLFAELFVAGEYGKPWREREAEHDDDADDEAGRHHVEVKLSGQVEGNQPEEDNKGHSKSNMLQEGDHQPGQEAARLPQARTHQQQQVQGDVETAHAEPGEGHGLRRGLRVVNQLEDGQPATKTKLQLYWIRLYGRYLL